MKYRVTTHHSVYMFDTIAKTARRVPVNPEASSLHGDGTDIPYDVVDIAIGQPLVIIWSDPEQQKKWRVTTPVLSVEDVDDEEGT